MSTGPTPTLPPLPTVDPAKHPKLAGIIALLKKYGPWILSLLGAFGVKLPFPIPGIGGQAGPTTAALAPANHDALEAALSKVDLADLTHCCQQAGVKP